MPTRSTSSRIFKRLAAPVAAVVLSLGVAAGGQADANPTASHKREHADQRAVNHKTRDHSEKTATNSSKAKRKAAKKAAHRKKDHRKKAAHKKKAATKKTGTNKSTSTTSGSAKAPVPTTSTTSVSAKGPVATTSTTSKATAPATSSSSSTQAPSGSPAPTSTTTTTTSGSSTGAPGDPLGGDQFYVYPSDSAVQEENTLISQGQTAEAAQIETIAREPEAIWLTYDGSQSVVPGVMSAAQSSGTVPVFVVYNIPLRDCGSYSSGGASSASDYESFIDSVVGALGQGKAVVVVEPDALSELSCLSSAEQQTYYQLIGYAAQHLDEDANASVYVDAGNPGWQPASTEAANLNAALGSTRAGFAVNVSNFASTAADISYGTQISQATGGRHFIIDTSRNGGNVTGGQWCNPSGAGIGADPTSNTGNPLVDADLWIKDVGESDGQCNGGPTAGQFWLSYALELVANG